MPVQTRQASQAASQMLQHRFNVNDSLHTPGLGGPTTHEWRESGDGMQLAHSQVLSNRAVRTTPANDTSTQRRVCIATPVEERMLAELASFEQGLSGGCPEISAPLEDPDGFEQDIEAQRESDVALQEAEALAEEALPDSTHHLWLRKQSMSRKAFASTYTMPQMSCMTPAFWRPCQQQEISQVQAAAHRLLSVCAVAKDSIQQQEVQHLK